MMETDQTSTPVLMMIEVLMMLMMVVLRMRMMIILLDHEEEEDYNEESNSLFTKNKENMSRLSTLPMGSITPQQSQHLDIHIWRSLAPQYAQRCLTVQQCVL